MSKKLSIEELYKKMQHHEARYDYYYEKIEAIVLQSKLIGFKPKNDHRMSSDLHQINVIALYNKE